MNKDRNGPFLNLLKSQNLQNPSNPLNFSKVYASISYGRSKRYPAPYAPYAYYAPVSGPAAAPAPLKIDGKYSTSPYGIKLHSTNTWLLAPAIFGTVVAFSLGFRFFGHPAITGYRKYIFFVSIWDIIASLGAGYYIYKLLLFRDHDNLLFHVVLPLLIVVLLFATTFNLTYSLYPFTFSGTIGDTKVTQFLSFLALSIGSISVGESFDVTPKTTGTQVLSATESFWNLFSLSLLISLLA